MKVFSNITEGVDILNLHIERHKTFIVFDWISFSLTHKETAFMRIKFYAHECRL